MFYMFSIQLNEFCYLINLDNDNMKCQYYKSVNSLQGRTLL